MSNTSLLTNKIGKNTVANADGLIINSANTQQKAERKPVDLYLNVGVYIDTTDENGQPAKAFLSIPYGIDVTNMPDRKVSGKDSAYNQLMNASNELLQMLREKGAALADGESVEVNLSCRLQKVSTTPNTNSGNLLAGITL
jgi:hypothetical protein